MSDGTVCCVWVLAVLGSLTDIYTSQIGLCYLAKPGTALGIMFYYLAEGKETWSYIMEIQYMRRDIFCLQHIGSRVQ